MLTFFHAPQSRSSRMDTLIHAMGIADKISTRIVTIRRPDGSGARDPSNPHPEGKVPALLHNGTLVTESATIILYLTDLFPESGLAPRTDDPKRAEYLKWLRWYAAVMDPAMTLSARGLSNPHIHAALRNAPEVTTPLETALSKTPYLLGETYSAADLLIHSPYAWMPTFTPDVPAIRDWVARCQSRPAATRTRDNDAALLAHHAGLHVQQAA